MKIKLLILSIFLLATIKGQSQEVRFGITANPGIVWVKPDNATVSSDGVRFGFDFGLVVDYVFGSQERYAFNSGLNLFISGANIKGTSTDSLGNTFTSSLTAKANYLEIPITIKLRSNEISYFTFYGQLGFAPQIKVRSRADFSYTDINGTVTGENVKFEDIPAYPKTIEKVAPFDAKLLVEAGLEYEIAENTVLVAGLFFNTGFINMFVDNDSERIVARNMGLRLSVLF